MIWVVQLLLLLGSPNMEVAVVARTCESLSHSFRGSCISKRNCGNVCHNEGFDDGVCRGFRRRCFCTRHC